VASRSRPALTRERILRAALKLIDRDGIDALSMRKLGRALGVEAMSLYRYVANKDAVLAGVVELLLDELELMPAGGGWRADAGRIVRSYRDVAQRHPKAFPLLALRPLPNAAAVERALKPVATLREAGLDEAGALTAYGVLLSYVNGHLLRELAGAPAPRASEEDPFELGLRVILAGLERVSVAQREDPPAAA